MFTNADQTVVVGFVVVSANEGGRRAIFAEDQSDKL